MMELKWLTNEEVNDLENEGLELNKMINSLINKIKIYI